MGTFSKGILGGFSGKVGTVVGTTWRGIDVMRSLPKKSKKVATATQLQQREKFSQVSDFLNQINAVVSSYFGSDKGEKTRRNRAMSYLLKEALTFENPDWVWNYSKVLISRGDLPGLATGNATSTVSNALEITWANNSDQGMALPNDKLVVVVYAESNQTALPFLLAGKRDETTTLVTLPAYFSGLSVQVWATFANENDTKYATSSYLGEVVLL